MRIFIISSIMVLMSISVVDAQEIPDTFIQEVTVEYNNIPREQIEQELKMTLEEYIAYKTFVYQSEQEAENRISTNRSIGDLCANGTFESGNINSNDWGFVWGDASNSGYSVKNTGAFTGSYTPSSPQQVHHQLQGIGPDDYVSTLNKVWNYPTGNTTSLRVGNAVNNQGHAAVYKKIVVTPTNASLSFSYAVVMNNPGGSHSISEKPFFAVELYEKMGFIRVYHNYLVNLGGNSNKLVSNDPLLRNSGNAEHGSQILYKDWSCVEVDLSSLIGKTIYVKFQTQDCTQGAHMGYAYIDNLCVACDEAPNLGGQLKLDNGASDDCGIPGEICIDYEVPQGNGTGQFDLQLIQNGVIVNTISSTTLSTGSTYCFNLTTSNTGSLDQSLGAFDYKIIGNYTLNGQTLTPRQIGTQNAGIKTGQNNDYDILCPPRCCPDEKTLNIEKDPNAKKLTDVPNGAPWSGNTPLSLGEETLVIGQNSVIPITELRIQVTDISIDSNYDTCLPCHDNAGLWASIDNANSDRIGDTINGLLIKTSNNVIGDQINQRELNYENSNGSMLKVGDRFKITFGMPSFSAIDCCVNQYTICYEISYKDANCNVCVEKFCSAFSNDN